MTATILPPQAQPSRDGSKRQIMATLSSSSSTTIPSDNEWLQTVQHELEQKINALHDDCVSEKSKQYDVFAAAMVKLPRNVRSMTVSEFNCVYKVNLLQNLQNPNLSAAAVAKNRLLQTPGTTHNPRNYGVTPSRTARKGEILMSQNGSPVEADGAGYNDENLLVATVTKPAPGGGKGGAPRLLSTSAAASLSINVGNGQFISLQDPSRVGQLGASEKNNALLQLQILKEQVASAIQNLED